jgi:hypothetical protein
MVPKSKTKRPFYQEWEHYVWMNPDDGRQVKCKYCLVVIFAGINRPNHHLVGIQCKDVALCYGFPAEVIAQMQVVLDNIKENPATLSLSFTNLSCPRDLVRISVV